jgi:hypothetical protein
MKDFMLKIWSGIKSLSSKVWDKIKFVSIYLVKFELGRFILGGSLMMIGGALAKDGVIGEVIFDRGGYDFWNDVMLFGILILLIQTVRFMTMAWIIQPIKWLINKFKNRK